jgi:hypothetical protein
MRQPLLDKDEDDLYFSDNTAYIDSGSEDDAAYDTDMPDGSDDDDLARLLADNNHPPEYFLRQEQEFDESEYTKQDYSEGSTQLLDCIEAQWLQ